MTKESSVPKKNAFAGAIGKLSDFQRKKPVVHEGELILKISPGQVECKPQIRKKGNPGLTVESLMELGDDIEANGQEQPAIVRKHPNPESGFDYEMVAGERRQRSTAMKGLLLDVVVRELTDEQAKRIQRSENVQREGLTMLEIALALKEDKDELGTLQKVAELWNKGLNWVAERLKYLETMEQDGVGRAAVLSGITADVSVVNDLRRLEQINRPAADGLLQRAEENPELNLRAEVRSELKRAKTKPSAKTTSEPKRSPKHQPNTAPSQEDLITQLNETVAVQATRIEALENENTYLAKELKELREQMASNWTPEQ